MSLVTRASISASDMGSQKRAAYISVSFTVNEPERESRSEIRGRGAQEGTDQTVLLRDVLADAAEDALVEIPSIERNGAALATWDTLSARSPTLISLTTDGGGGRTAADAAREEVEERGLAGARGAEHAQELAGAHDAVQTLQQELAVRLRVRARLYVGLLPLGLHRVREVRERQRYRGALRQLKLIADLDVV